MKTLNDALPDLVPVLMECWRGLMADLDGLVSNPNVEPGELDAARSHLHALLGQAALMPKDGELRAHPTLNAKGPSEVSPLPLIVVGRRDSHCSYSPDTSASQVK